MGRMRIGGVLSAAHAESEDWSFCRDILLEVSRTFSQPIGLLPAELERPVTLGYLLCRLVDTIEDTEDIEPEQRARLFAAFVDCLRGAGSDSLEPILTSHTLSDAERRLVLGSGRLFRLFHAQSPEVREITVRWTTEMAHGMRCYADRMDAVGFFCPEDIEDLERYCYYVAGTVGHLITDLYVDWLLARGVRPGNLRPHAEAFGLGLQLVNMVKDVTDDFQRGVCFVPRRVCQEHGISPEQLLAPEQRKAALLATRVIVRRAYAHLEKGLDYLLALPNEPAGLRLFCALPLIMALETLNLARDDSLLLNHERRMKISRQDVSRIIATCALLVADDDALASHYAKLSQSAHATQD